MSTQYLEIRIERRGGSFFMKPLAHGVLVALEHAQVMLAQPPSGYVAIPSEQSQEFLQDMANGRAESDLAKGFAVQRRVSLDGFLRWAGDAVSAHIRAYLAGET